MKENPLDPYGIGKPSSNYKILLKFVSQLKRAKAKGDKETMKEALKQIRGRVFNLLLELEEVD